MTNYTSQTKNLLQKQKAASFFNKADVGTNGGLGKYLTVYASFSLKLQINPGFYIKIGNLVIETGWT